MIDSFSSILSISDREFNDMVTYVYGKFGIDLSKKKQLIEGRLSHTLKSKGIKSFGDYLRILKSPSTDPTEVQAFLNIITTNHSYFARETEHFDYLVKTVLPELERSRPKVLRIWSAGCSSGQEAYNMAMVIDQYFGNRKSQWDTTILASDISTKVLTKAQEGIYPEDNLTGLPDSWKSNYFKKLPNGHYQVVDKIRNEVVFRTGNLMEPFRVKNPFDIIFCRNVMIYFDKDTTNRLVRKFYDVTADNGYLFIGHSESVDKTTIKYKYVKPAIYKRALGG